MMVPNGVPGGIVYLEEEQSASQIEDTKRLIRKEWCNEKVRVQFLLRRRTVKLPWYGNIEVTFDCKVYMN